MAAPSKWSSATTPAILMKPIAKCANLIELEGVEVLQGTVSSTVTGALQSAAQEYEIVLLAGPSASHHLLLGVTSMIILSALAATASKMRSRLPTMLLKTWVRTTSNLAPDNAFGLGSAGAFDFGLQAAGATPVADTVLVAGDTTDFTEALSFG